MCIEFPLICGLHNASERRAKLGGLHYTGRSVLQNTLDLLVLLDNRGFDKS